MLIGRTGYTGEDGVELFFPAAEAVKIWEMILAAGPAHGIDIKPIGLAARDSLRFEPSFSLYGHEIDEHLSPMEARLGWACKLDHDFIGREALLKQKEEGTAQKLIGFELTEKAVPRQGYPVANAAGEVIGQVVTGMYTPTVEKYCGHAYVPAEYAKLGTPLQILVRDKAKSAKVVRRPFYKPAYQDKATEA